MKKNKKKSDPSNPDRRKKPVTVSGNCISYTAKLNNEISLYLVSALF